MNAQSEKKMACSNHWRNRLHPLLILLQSSKAMGRNKLRPLLIKPQILHYYTVLKIRLGQGLPELSPQQRSPPRYPVDLERVWIVMNDMHRDPTKTFNNTRYTDELTSLNVVLVLVLKFIHLENHSPVLPIPNEIRPVRTANRPVCVGIRLVP